MTPGWREVLVTSQADGTALTAAAAASMIPAASKYTLQANFFGSIGKKLIIEATGRISSVITTPGTARYDVRFGATVVFDSLAMLLDTAVAAVNVGWYLKIILTCRTIGATANLFGQGFFTAYNLLGTPATPPKGGLTAMLPWNSAPAVGNNFDATATQQVDLFFTQTVATGSMTCHQYSLTAENPPQ
jgi:hypothetical protein